MTETNNIRCSERRHMSSSEFMTYDAMRACIGDHVPRVFWGSAYTLANLNDRSVQRERDSLNDLEAKGWIIDETPDGHRFHGKMDTKKYRVLTHDEWLERTATCPEPRTCPPAKYVKVKGDRWTTTAPGETPMHIRRSNVTKILTKFAEMATWLIAKGDQRRGTDKPVTDTRKLVTADDDRHKEACAGPSQESLCATVTRNLVTTDTRKLVPTDTRKLVTSLIREAESAKPNQFSHTIPAFPDSLNPESNGGEPERSGVMGVKGNPPVTLEPLPLGASPQTPALGGQPEATATPTPATIDDPKFVEFWKKLTNHVELPDGLRLAGRWTKGKLAIFKLYEWGVTVEEIVEQADEWNDNRQQPIDTFPGDRWLQFADENRGYFDDMISWKIFEEGRAAKKAQNAKAGKV